MTWFCFDGDSFETYNTADEARKAADDALSDYRDNACDGWDDNSMNIAWGRVLGSVQVTERRPRTEADFVAQHITEIENRELVSDNEYRCLICGGVVAFDGTPPQPDRNLGSGRK